MWAYIICTGIWIGFLLHWMTGSIPKQRIFEVYSGCSIGINLTLLIFGLFGWYKNVVFPFLQIIGSALIIITIILAFLSLITLRIRGKPKKGIEDTTILIEKTIFHIIRHFLYLGFTL
jgi:protein-S-isoprenylcysteine O-methyltransferase Ste14